MVCYWKKSERKNIGYVFYGGVFFCLGVLFFFKYFNFSIEILETILGKIGISFRNTTLNILLPIGISFYTFQTLSYIIDVYRGQTFAEHHLGKYAVFISFFPQLVAGPIEKSENLLVQLKAGHTFCYEKATYGLKIMAWGYFKKCLIADTLGVYVNTVYDDVMQHSGFAFVGATLMFAIQIYCDFSGYSDIARGTAKLMDIDLIDNFKSPYLSGSIREFWRRWHISLSRWFMEYVYIPLGGNRVSHFKRDLNIFITFLVSGLWHGANYTYIIWGGLHGIYQIVEKHLPKRKHLNIMQKAIHVIITFLGCTFAWIFFRSVCIKDAHYIIVHMLDGISMPISYVKNGLNDMGIYTWHELLQISGMLGILLIYDYVSLRKDVFLLLQKCNVVVRWCFYLVLGVSIILMAQKGVKTEFVYFQF